MLHRADVTGIVGITQPAHAWVAGQLARAWGNERFFRPEPWEEVCLAAERHDDGWLSWEAAPTLNPATGRPYSFLELPRAEHLALWRAAGRSVLAFGRYPALLVSMHGTGLYERRDTSNDPPNEAAAIKEFLAGQHAFQTALLDELRADPLFAAHAAPDVVFSNRRLVAVWDALSLALCGGRTEPRQFGGVPARDGETVLSLTPKPDDPTKVAVKPWPFGTAALTLRFEGRRLPDRSASEADMRLALAEAPWVSFETRLVPAESGGEH